MINEQFGTIFINSFALDPDKIGMVVAGNIGMFEGHQIKLVEIRGRLSHWEIDGEHMVDWELYNRDDSRRQTNKQALMEKLGMEEENNG